MNIYLNELIIFLVTTIFYEENAFISFNLDDFEMKLKSHHQRKAYLEKEKMIKLLENGDHKTYQKYINSSYPGKKEFPYESIDVFSKKEDSIKQEKQKSKSENHSNELIKKLEKYSFVSSNFTEETYKRYDKVKPITINHFKALKEKGERGDQKLIVVSPYYYRDAFIKSLYKGKELSQSYKDAYKDVKDGLKEIVSDGFLSVDDCEEQLRRIFIINSRDDSPNGPFKKWICGEASFIKDKNSIIAFTAAVLCSANDEAKKKIEERLFKDFEIKDHNIRLNNANLSLGVVLLLNSAGNDKRFLIEKERFQKRINTLNNAGSLLNKTQKKLRNATEYFDPRGLDNWKNQRIDELFVMPSFDGNSNLVERIKSYNGNVLILGESGLGKSLFLQAIVYSSVSDQNEKSPLSRLNIKKTILYITALDFVEYCLKHTEKAEKGPINLEDVFLEKYLEAEYSENTLFKEQLEDYAKTGNLLLIFDAFDEITDQLRGVFLESLSIYIKNYGIKDDTKKGSSIIVSSRDTETEMGSLKQEMKNDLTETHYISFGEEEKICLINRWSQIIVGQDKWADVPDSSKENAKILSENIQEKVLKNPYFSEISSSPAMLACICSNFNAYGSQKNGLKTITENYINTLFNKPVNRLNATQSAYDANSVLYAIINNGSYFSLYNLLGSLAYRMISKGKKISSQDLQEEIMIVWDKYLEDNRFTRCRYEDIIGRFQELLTTKFGLFLPEKKDKGHFNFANMQFARYFCVRYLKKCDDVREKIKMIEDYRVFVMLFAEYNDKDLFKDSSLKLIEGLIDDLINCSNDDFVKHCINDIRNNTYDISISTFEGARNQIKKTQITINEKMDRYLADHSENNNPI